MNLITEFNNLSTISKIGLIAIFVIVVLFIVLIMFKIIKKHKLNCEIKSREADDVKLRHGIRYTEDLTIVDKEGNANVSYGIDDCLLKINTPYYASKSGYVHPGSYTILSTKDTDKKFNIRIGDYVKEYSHGQKIVLTEGEEITPVSTDIILR